MRKSLPSTALAIAIVTAFINAASFAGEALDAEKWDLVSIPGSVFVMGDTAGEPDEAPREVTIGTFRIMRHEVTNRQFADYVTQTRHISDPERRGEGYVWADRWRSVPKADWKSPHGPASGIDDLDEHPVVQVSHRDAAAFCAYYGMRLPGEHEWELAARGTDGRKFPWGSAAPERPDGTRFANFGTVKCCAPDTSDGYRSTAPVTSFPSGASPYGILNMAGNVWEWTSTPFPSRPEWSVIRGGGWGNNPYCLRASYRHGNPRDIGLDMVGFRCAADPG